MKLDETGVGVWPALRPRCDRPQTRTLNQSDRHGHERSFSLLYTWQRLVQCSCQHVSS